jgi:hypothetical protein
MCSCQAVRFEIVVVLNCCQSLDKWRSDYVEVHELWLPPMDKKTQETGLDILFVPGRLWKDTASARGWRGTWMQRDNPDVCWPEVWLPAALGFNVRILSVSYNDALLKKDFPQQVSADFIASALCCVLFLWYNQISCHFIIRNLSDCSSNPLAVLLCVCVCVCLSLSLSPKAVLLCCAGAIAS